MTYKAIVECGDLYWTGRSKTFNEAVSKALRWRRPRSPAVLLRANVHPGIWFYIEYVEALKIASEATP